MSTSASADLRNVLAKILAELCPPDSGQLDLLQAHYDLLVRWNRVLNLTRIEDAREAAERHYAESLFLASRLPKQPLRIADIGSGAGFPGLPVAVVRPDCAVTLIECHQRKAVFLREAGRKIPNIQVESSRAESVLSGFDWAISRAVSYEDLRPILSQLGTHAALLTGPEAPPNDMGIEWREPEKLPWGKQRFLRFGVSRETA